MLKVVSPFIDGINRLRNVGESVDGQYDEKVLSHYLRCGLIGEFAQEKNDLPDANKVDAPLENKGKKRNGHRNA